VTPEMYRYMLASQPCTANQIAQAVGISDGSVRKQYAKGEMHIVGYVRQPNGWNRALYVLGEGEDVPRPKPIPSTKVQKAYRERHKALINARRKFKGTIALGVWKGLK